ncbi:MAG: alpha/beta fold hydrolase [Chloroflexi bacterium]|nr:alpha/beta fold hydrolase [Chloroflexota bacterium]
MSKKILLTILMPIFFSVAIYFGIATVLIVSGKPDKLIQDESNLAFNELFFDYEGLPELQSFQARDGASLDYRYYQSESDKVLILLHGSGYHSKYLMPLAKYISAEGLAQVYTPDLRGHGLMPEQRGDVDYIEQLDDDIADLITVVRADHPNATIIVGGHSSGGGLAIRFAGSKYGQQADAYLLLSPFLKYNAPTVRPNSGGWAQPYTGRIAGLVMLNNVGIGWFNDLTVIKFNMPEEARDGTETLSYTYRLNTAYAPRNYKTDLAAITQPMLVVAGTADEVFYAEQFEPVISQYVPDVQVKLLNGVTHMGVVVGDDIQPIIEEWLKSLGTP